MATTRSIVTQALMKLGVIGPLKAPLQTDLDLGLSALQSIYRELIQNGVLGRARDVIPTADYTAGEQDRIRITSDAYYQVTLPDMVSLCSAPEFLPGDYDYGLATTAMVQQRGVRHGAFVIIIDERTNKMVDYIRDAYLGLWMSIDDLSTEGNQTLRDENNHLLDTITASVAPLSQNSNGLASLLATKLADYFGATPSPLMMRDGQIWINSLAQSFGEAEGSLAFPIC